MFLLSGQKGRDAMKTDRKIGRGLSVHKYRHPLLASINPYLSCLESLHDAATRRWSPQAAATAAVLMALDASHALFVRWHDARTCMHAGLPGKKVMGKTYNGLIKALLRQAHMVLPALKAGLRDHARAALRVIPPTCSWRLLAVDGSRELLPRTLDHEQLFGIADNGKCPQALVTAVVEVHTGLLWDWRIDRADGSEKGHLVDMARALPARSLLLADGNFVGYGVWSALDQSGISFLIRVGGNVDLLTGLFPEAAVERRGRIVYTWPKGKQGKCPPLRLRLIRVGSPGKTVWLLTNVLNARRLSRQAAGKIYRCRWGAELFYRAFKRTWGFAKLKSRSGRRGLIELEWALIACCIMSLLGIAVLKKHRQDPRRLSPAGLIHVLRDMLFHGQRARSQATLRQWRGQLALAVRDNYHRHAPKQSRHRPVTKSTPKVHQLKPPKLRVATDKERLLALQKCPKLAA
jgi:hypothetical protein